MNIKENHKFDDTLVMTYAQHFRSMFSRSISIIRAFEEEFGKERVEEVLTRWSEQAGCDGTTKEIDSFSEFKDYWKTTLESENWKKVLTCSFPKETETELKCEYSECLFAKTMKDMDAQDLGYIIFCHPDFAIAESMHPSLKLERTKTIMQGDTCCDHEYSWTE